MNQKNILSIGRAASVIQALPGEIRLVASQLEIEPVLTINSTEYFAAGDIDRIGKIIHVRSIDTARAMYDKRNLR